MSDTTSFRRLGRNTALYGAAVVVGRIVGIAMLPFYTRYLSPAQYGLLQLLDISIEITYILFSAGSRSGVQRFYFRAQTERERRAVVFTAYALELSLSTLGTLALVALAVPVHQWVLAGEGAPGFVRIAALNFVLSAVAGVPLLLLQIEQRAAWHSAAVLVKLAIQVTLNVVFLLHGLGVAAILWSTAIANATIGVALAVYLLSRTGVASNRMILRDLRRFGVPYQITMAGSFILAFGDRFFLQHSHGAAAVGLYGLAYQVGFLFYYLTTSPFLRAWEPQRFELASRPRAERDAQYARGFFYLNLFLLTVAVGIAVFIRPVIGVLTTGPFHDAALLVPLILAAYVVQSWGEVAKFGIDMSERTKLYTYASWSATIVVLVLYAVLIPPLGGYGAALATLLAFLVRFLLAYRWSQQVFPVSYPWARVLRLAAIATLVVLPAVLWPPSGMIGQLALGTVLVAIFTLTAWMLVLTHDERAALAGVARTIRASTVLRRT